MLIGYNNFATHSHRSTCIYTMSMVILDKNLAAFAFSESKEKRNKALVVNLLSAFADWFG